MALCSSNTFDTLRCMAYFDFLEDFEELERRDIRCLGEVELKEDRDDESEFRWGSDIGNGRLELMWIVWCKGGGGWVWCGGV